MKLDSQALSNIVSVGLAGYGGFLVWQSQNSLSQADGVKGVSAVVVGVLCLAYANKDKFLEYWKARPKSQKVFSPEDFEEQDFRCLIHLRNRVTEANCPEGIETCEKLNSIIFSLHARERVKVVQNSLPAKETK